MSEQKEIIKQEPVTRALVTPSAVKARDMAERIKYMIVNGRNLAQQEVFALAQYCAANGVRFSHPLRIVTAGAPPPPAVIRAAKLASLVWSAAHR